MNHELAPTIAGCLIAAMCAAAPLLHAAEPPSAAQPKVTPDSPRLAPRESVSTATTREPKDKTGMPTAATRQNCGTFWTGWVADPNADVNPCPKDCVRGERQLVKTHKQGNTLLYDARYQCYRMATVTPPKPESQGGLKEDRRSAFQPKVITTEAMQLTGTRRPAFVPKIIATEPMQLTGMRRAPFTPKVITTEAMQLTGMRRPPFTPKVITTEPMQLTGTRLTQMPAKTDRSIEAVAPPGAPARSRGK